MNDEEPEKVKLCEPGPFHKVENQIIGVGSGRSWGRPPQSKGKNPLFVPL